MGTSWMGPEGVARLTRTPDELARDARKAITAAREATHVLMEAQLIGPPPAP